MTKRPCPACDGVRDSALHLACDDCMKRLDPGKLEKAEQTFRRYRAACMDAIRWLLEHPKGSDKTKRPYIDPNERRISGTIAVDLGRIRITFEGTRDGETFDVTDWKMPSMDNALIREAIEAALADAGRVMHGDYDDEPSGGEGRD
jgi:hypothetical protein